MERNLHPLNHVILDPMRIPPLFRIDLYAVQLHAEVDVIAARHPGHSAQAHRLAALHIVADLHIDLAHVSVDRLQAVAMIDDHAVAVDASGAAKTTRPSLEAMTPACCVEARS